MSCLVDFERNLQSPAGLLYRYLPHIVCFPIHLQFPLFLAPLTSKKEICLLLITVLLTSLSTRFFSARLKLAAFYAAVSHVAPFFSASHTQTSNRKLHIVSHVLTLRVSAVEVNSKYCWVFHWWREEELALRFLQHWRTVSSTSAMARTLLISSQFEKRGKGLWFKSSE